MDKKKYSLPYGIDFVLNLDFPDLKHYGIHNGEEDIDCPFCGRKRKAHVSYKGNVFRCNACDSSGGILKLHMLAKGFSDTKTAKQDLDNIYQDSDRKKINIINSKNFEENSKPFPDYIIHKIYTNLLENLDLNNHDYKNLISRGLTEEDIIRNQYRSYPIKFPVMIAEQSLLGTLNTDNLKKTIEYYSSKMQNKTGIPGFYVNHGDISLMLKKEAGYLIPIRNLNGEITSMQVRNFLSKKASEEDKENFRKYVWLSSKAKYGGCGVHEVNQIHFTGFNYQSPATPKSVFFTEGCLKADVASSLMKQIGFTKEYAPFIAVMGVNNTAQLPNVFQMLKERGTHEICLCFDMDYTENPNVNKARDKVKQLIRDSGLQCRSMNWNPEYKGIDDYLLSLKVKKELALN